MSLSFKLDKSIQDTQAIARYEGKTAVQLICDPKDGEATFATTGDEAGVIAAAAFLLRNIAQHNEISIGKASKKIAKIAKIMPDPAEDA